MHLVTHFRKNVWQSEIDPTTNQPSLRRVRLLDLKDVSLDVATTVIHRSHVLYT